VERIARDVPAPVLVVPEGEHRTPARIVAAVDDGRWAPRIVAEAAAIARAHGAELTVLHVLSASHLAVDRLTQLLPSNGVAAPPAATALGVHPAAHQWLRQLTASGAHGRPPRVAVCVGDAEHEIVRAAAAPEVGLLVIGKRGSDGAPAGSIGSVARDVLRRAPCPVLAVDFDSEQDRADARPLPPAGQLRLVTDTKRRP
jgi:nucleotide-binding universal stress UspA family protein